MSRKDVAARSGWSLSKIEKTESGLLPATEDYVRDVLPVVREGVDIEALFGRMQQDGLRRPVFSDWFRDYLHIEQQADTIRFYEPDVVPGLLQSEGYARALLTREVELATRMGRKAIFTRDHPPTVIAVLGENVLHRLVGSPVVMTEQLASLLEPPAVVQVLPSDTDTYAGLDGSFVLTSVGDRDYLHVSTVAQGVTLDDRESVSRAQRAWDEIRGSALPPRQSQQLIMEVAEKWQTRT